MQRRGFTLIEMLVSLAISLIMMAAVATLFGVVSSSVSKSRSLIETSDRLRAAREVIQRDLDGMTATLKPPLSPENGPGYFEIIEGPAQDRQPLIETGAKQELFGDIDDVLMFTTRGRDPFLGKYLPPGGPQRIIESPVAEVVYFLVQNGPQIDTQILDPANNPVGRLCTLYRRILLVSPSIGSTTTIPPDFYSQNDLSVHHTSASGTPTLTANTLGDLTKRENRFAHYGDFPFLVDRTAVAKYPFSVLSAPAVPPGMTGRPNAPSAFLQPFDGARLGDDVLLTNVIAFDVRVWDSDAPVRVSDDQAVTPSDNGWHLPGAVDIGNGAYVDLGYDPASLSDLGRVNPHQKPRGGSQFLIPNAPADARIYDTWSLHYENDGIDQDGALVADTGTNGLDDDSDGLIDDLVLDPAANSEWDTHPPYAIPLRGLQVTVRVYEPSSQQVREVEIITVAR